MTTAMEALIEQVDTHTVRVTLRGVPNSPQAINALVAELTQGAAAMLPGEMPPGLERSLPPGVDLSSVPLPRAAVDVYRTLEPEGEGFVTVRLLVWSRSTRDDVDLGDVMRPAMADRLRRNHPGAHIEAPERGPPGMPDVPPPHDVQAPPAAAVGKRPPAK